MGYWKKSEICVHTISQQGRPKTYLKTKKRVKNEEKDHFEHF